MSVPIQNIYYLLCYAWHILEEEDSQSVNAISSDNSFDLLLHLLQKQTAKLVKHGLTTDYIRQTNILKGIKGKLEFSASIRQDLFRQGQAVCTYEILSADILPNQLIKSVLYVLLNTPALKQEQHGSLRQLYQTFSEVNLIQIAPEHFRHIATARYFNKYYSPVLLICEVIWQQLLPEPGSEQFKFTDFRQDERQMARLFEAFVRNFYFREQSEFTVKSERINWQVADQESGDLQYLPQMVTDISLLSAQRKIIIDTKYYKQALVPHYDKQKLISGHLYQLFAYLKNQQNSQTVKTEGILLYPVVNQELDLKYQLPGHQISIKTINLNQPWQNIKADLLNMIA